MSDQPTDPPPRVDILPAGRPAPGRILRWRQAPDGHWWAEVTLYVPAEAVRQVDGQDYTAVPREAAAPPASPPPAGPAFVLTADTRPGQPRTATLHKGDCWTLGDTASWIRTTPISDAATAAGMLRFDDTTPCDICTPRP